MKLVKKALRRIVRPFGYELVPAARVGEDPFRDVQKLYGTRAVEVAFDVGANEGQTAIECARAFPAASIYSFEPFAASFKVLQENSRPFEKIKPLPIALGDIAGEQQLFVNKFSPTNSLLPLSKPSDEFVSADWIKPLGTEAIKVSTLDASCAELDVKFIDLLKMDVQGFEKRVLTGGGHMLAGRVAAVLTEVLFVSLYDGQSYFPELYAHLYEKGFRLVRFYNPSFSDKHYMSWCDALFIHPEVLAGRLKTSAK